MFRSKIRISAMLATLLAAPHAHCSDYYWDGGTTNIAGDGDGQSAGGDGTWNTSIKNWDVGTSPHVAWSNGNTAILGGTNATITMAAGLTAAHLVINSTHTLAGQPLSIATGGIISKSSGAGFAQLTANGLLSPQDGVFRINNPNTSKVSNFGPSFRIYGPITGGSQSVEIQGNGASYAAPVGLGTGPLSYGGTTTIADHAMLIFDVNSNPAIPDNSITVGVDGCVIVDQGLSNTFLKKINPTGGHNQYIGMWTSGTSNALDLSGSNGGQDLPNASLCSWWPNFSRTAEFTGAITAGSRGYRFGSPRSYNNLFVNNSTGTADNVLSGSAGLELVAETEVSLTIQGANSFTGATINQSPGREIFLLHDLAIQNSAIDTSGEGVYKFTGSVRTGSNSYAPVTVTTPTIGGLIGSKHLATIVTDGLDGLTSLTLNPPAGKELSYSGTISDGAPAMALTKSGDGIQILTGTQTYTGPTNVTAGTLTLDGTLAPETDVTISGGMLDGSGLIPGNATVSGGVLNSSGTINGDVLVTSGVLNGAGMVDGRITVQAAGEITPKSPQSRMISANNATLQGTLNITIDDVAPASGDLLNIIDELVLSGSTLNLNVTAETVQEAYVIANYGIISGTFGTVNNLPAGWTIDYSYGEGTFGAGTTIALVPPAPSSAPPAPLNSSATSALTADGSTSLVNVNWDPATDAAYYTVKRSTSIGGPYTEIATVYSRPYVDLNVVVGQTYYYVISAGNVVGDSADSAQASVTVVAPPVPLAPTNLAIDLGNGIVSLTWDASAATSSYKILRGTSPGGPYGEVGTATDTNHVDFSGAVGTTYYYVVVAVNSGGDSPNSNEVSGVFPEDPLLASIQRLVDHIDGTTPLSDADVQANGETIRAQTSRYAESTNTLTALQGLISTYDSVIGALWLSPRPDSFARNTDDGSLDWQIYHIMQAMFDTIYTLDTVAQYHATLDGYSFGSSQHFPGACPLPADPNATQNVQIDATYLDAPGRETQGEELPARKPTGYYLAPGAIVTVTVPPALVNSGYQIRVGAHSWDFSNRPNVKRLDRVSAVYNIVNASTKVASPLGGGIYIEVPREADNGVVTVSIQGASKSPLFSTQDFLTTTNAEWAAIDWNNMAPWADFQSEKFMMQVPTSWVFALSDPTSLMAKWDLAMDIQNQLQGFPLIRGKETIYAQVDLQPRASVQAPGYPSTNASYSPNTTYSGDHFHHLVRGPEVAQAYEFHEQGHGYRMPHLSDESEVTTNMPHVAVMDRGFYTEPDRLLRLEKAFRSSRDYNNTYMTLDTTAMAWMTVFSFTPRRVEMAAGEKSYYLKGHAKYVDIVRLYGWDGIDAYFSTYMDEQEAGTLSNYEKSDDGKILRYCQTVGKDLRPLFHFWGLFPDDPVTLEANLVAEGLTPPAEIYDLITHYKTLIPANNAEFQTFALNWWGRQPSINGFWEEREHARQWDTTPLYGTGDQQRSEATNPGEIYNENSAADIHDRVQQIIDIYYPDGRPTADYDDWAANFPSATLTDPNGDFDGDGMTNDEERLFGLNPELASSVNPITTPYAPATGTFSYSRRDPSLTLTTYSIWSSTDLTNWVEDTGAVQTAGAPDSNDIQSVSVTISPSLLSEPDLFLRIETSP